MSRINTSGNVVAATSGVVLLGADTFTTTKTLGWNIDISLLSIYQRIVVEAALKVHSSTAPHWGVNSNGNLTGVRVRANGTLEQVLHNGALNPGFPMKADNASAITFRAIITPGVGTRKVGNVWIDMDSRESARWQFQTEQSANMFTLTGQALAGSVLVTGVPR